MLTFFHQSRQLIFETISFPSTVEPLFHTDESLEEVILKLRAATADSNHQAFR